MSCIRLPSLAAQARFDTPLGPMTAAASARGLVGLWFDDQAHHPGALDAPVNPAHAVLAIARRALEHWFDGRRQLPPDLALDLQGTPFQRAVWQALLAIPAGQTRAYAQVAAAAAGAPAAVRAAGAAIGRNPVSLLVPCHRVIGAGGGLTGYAGGLERKAALLRLEREAAAARQEGLHAAA